MKLQEEIIQAFNQLYDYPTLRFISEKTGIQLTRVFRIIHGAEMKISEYEAFKKCIESKTIQSEQSLKKIIDRSLRILNESQIKDIHNTIQTKIDNTMIIKRGA